MKPLLYSYFRSSCSYRVRIALALKNIECEYRYVNLKPGVSEQHTDDYTSLNPQGLVPLYVDQDVSLGQSTAILEYLEDTYSSARLLPVNREERARVRQLVNLIACEIQPLNNLSVLVYLKDRFKADDEQASDWYAQWVHRGFSALEQLLLTPATGAFCHGNAPTMADVYLVPQVWNARRFQVPLDDYPTITRIADKCNTLPAFIAAAPELQLDNPDYVDDNTEAQSYSPQEENSAD